MLEQISLFLHFGNQLKCLVPLGFLIHKESFYFSVCGANMTEYAVMMLGGCVMEPQGVLEPITNKYWLIKWPHSLIEVSRWSTLIGVSEG